MDLPAVLRVPRIDDEASFAVVHVSSAGKSALDLKLIGTDGESVFAITGKLAIGSIFPVVLGHPFHALFRELTNQALLDSQA
jgi:hypothetical protein